MVGAFPGSKEEYVHDKVERQAGAQSEGDLKAILGVQLFFFFMKNHCIVLSLKEHTQNFLKLILASVWRIDWRGWQGTFSVI